MRCDVCDKKIVGEGHLWEARRNYCRKNQTICNACNDRRNAILAEFFSVDHDCSDWKSENGGDCHCAFCGKAKHYSSASRPSSSRDIGA